MGKDTEEFNTENDVEKTESVDIGEVNIDENSEEVLDSNESNFEDASNEKLNETIDEAENDQPSMEEPADGDLNVEQEAQDDYVDKRLQEEEINEDLPVNNNVEEVSETNENQEIDNNEVAPDFLEEKQEEASVYDNQDNNLEEANQEEAPAEEKPLEEPAVEDELEDDEYAPDIQEEESVSYKELLFQEAQQHEAEHQNETENDNMNVEIEDNQEQPVEREVSEHVEEVNPEIDNRNKVSLFCENCGAVLTGYSKYCGVCGVKVSMKICKHCGKVISVAETVCPFCKGELDDATEVVPKEQLVEEETPKTEEVIPAPVEKVEDKKEAKPKKNKKQKELPEYKQVVNMLRKRIVLGVQLLLVVILALMMFFVPIMTSKPLYNSLGSLNNEPLVTLSKLITSMMGEGQNSTLIAVNNQPIFMGLPFVQTVLGWFAAQDQAATLSVYLMLFIYGFIGLSLILQVLICGFGMLTHRPIRGKSAKFTLITLVISAIFIYTNLFSGNYAGYDSWIAYAFALFFIYWVTVKIMFYKEVREYNDLKY